MSAASLHAASPGHSGGTLFDYDDAIMRVDTARVCLHCDELHERDLCPACGSETFAFLRRWVPPAPERPRRTPPAPGAGEAAATQIDVAYRPRRTTAWFRSSHKSATVGPAPGPAPKQPSGDGEHTP